MEKLFHKLHIKSPSKKKQHQQHHEEEATSQEVPEGAVEVPIEVPVAFTPEQVRKGEIDVGEIVQEAIASGQVEVPKTISGQKFEEEEERGEQEQHVPSYAEVAAPTGVPEESVVEAGSKAEELLQQVPESGELKVQKGGYYREQQQQHHEEQQHVEEAAEVREEEQQQVIVGEEQKVPEIEISSIGLGGLTVPSGAEEIAHGEEEVKSPTSSVDLGSLKEGRREEGEAPMAYKGWPPVPQANLEMSQEQEGEGREEATPSEEAPMAYKEWPPVPQANLEMAEGGQVEKPEEEQPSPMAFREGSIVPQVKVEGFEEKEKEQPEQQGAEWTKRKGLVPQLCAESSEPTEEERQRLQRGAFVTEYPYAAEGQEEKKPRVELEHRVVPEGLAPQIRVEEAEEVPPHAEVPEQPSIPEVIEKLAEERGVSTEEVKTELREQLLEEEVFRSQEETRRLTEIAEEVCRKEPKEARKEGQKICIIVGQSEGFGFELAKGLLKRQPEWIVYLCDHDESAGAAAIRRLNNDYQLEARFHPLNADSMVSLRTFRDYLCEQHGDECIDVLISNVGNVLDVNKPAGSAEEFRFDKTVFDDTIRRAYFGNLSLCLELFPMLANDAKVVFTSSRFGQIVFMHSNETLQQRIRSCNKIEQVSELMELLIGTDASALTGMLSETPAHSIWGNYTLGSIYPYGMAKLGVTLLTMCYQRQLDEEKANKNVAINCVCPGMESGDKSPEELCDPIMWLVMEQPRDSPIRGCFVANRKVIDPLFIEPTAELF